MVTLVALASHQISDREAEKASLEAELAAAQVQAQKLQKFADFATLQEARDQTVLSLAQSRFDWERVLRELAIVIPSDISLTNLEAQVSPDSATSSSSSSSSTE